jgi:hypothetical protein
VLSHAPPPSQPERQVRMDTKKCNRCGESKSTDEFRLRKSRQTFWRCTTCKACELAYDRAYKEAHREEKSAYARVHSRTPAGRASQQRYRQSDDGKQYRREFQRAYTLHRWHNCPEARLHMLARNSVGMALRSGKLRRPTICQHCGGPGPIQSHHHRGYDRKYWRDVVWLCAECHRSADASAKQEEIAQCQPAIRSISV